MVDLEAGADDAVGQVKGALSKGWDTFKKLPTWAKIIVAVILALIVLLIAECSKPAPALAARPAPRRRIPRPHPLAGASIPVAPTSPRRSLNPAVSPAPEPWSTAPVGERWALGQRGIDPHVAAQAAPVKTTAKTKKAAAPIEGRAQVIAVAAKVTHAGVRKA